MAQIVDEAVIVITADMTQFDKAMALTPKAAEKAAVSAGKATDKAVDKAVKAVEKAAERAAGEAEAAAARVLKANDTAYKAAAAAAARQAEAAEKAAMRQAASAEAAAARVQKANDVAYAKVVADAAKAQKAHEMTAAKSIIAATRSSAAATKTASGWGAVAKQIQQSTLVSELETVSALFMQVGGSVSRVSGVVTSLIRPMAILGTGVAQMSGALLPVAGGFAAMAVAAAGLPVLLGAITMAVKGVADGGLEARDRLKELGKPIDPAAEVALRSYERSAQELAVAMDQVRVTIGALAAGEMAVLATMLTSSVKPATEAVTTAWYAWRTAVFLLTLGLSELAVLLEGKVYNALTANARAAVEMGNAMDEAGRKAKSASAAAAAASNEQSRAAIAALEATAAADEREGARQNALMKERVANAKAAAAAEKALQNDRYSAVAAGIKAEGARYKAGHKEIEAAQKTHWDAMARMGTAWEKVATQDFKAYVDGIIAEQARQTADFVAQEKVKADIRETMARAAIDNANAGFSVVEAFNARALDEHQAMIDRKVAQEERLEDRRATLREALRTATTESSRAALKESLVEANQKIANARKAANEARKEAMKTWKQNRALQIAQTLINAAATFGMVAATSPIPFPWNLVAAGSASATVASQAAIIASRKPPSFHTGGMIRGGGPDEMPITALSGEAVVSRRGVQAAGGPAAVDALNKGQAPQGQGQATEVNVYIDGDKVAARIEQRMKTGRRNAHALRGR